MKTSTPAGSEPPASSPHRPAGARPALASELLLRGIVGSALDAIICVDAEQRLVLFNHAAEQIFRCRAEQVLGERLECLLPERFRARHAMLVEGFGQSGVSARSLRSPSVLTGLRADGEEFPIEAAISQVEEAGQKLYTVVLRDISEHRQLEEQLRQSQKMEAVGRLAGGIAHDFNNLLTTIRCNAELALKALPADSPVRAEVWEIERAASRAAHLTRQLLAFSRKQRLRLQVVDLNTSLLDMERMLGRIIGEDVLLVTRLEEALWRVRADPSQLEQVVLNLVVNARDAMPLGGTLEMGTANVELEPRVAEALGVPVGAYVRLQVRDTGCGMDDAVLGRIFEPFFTTKEQGKGTGLGLSTVYGIVRQSHGAIAVESAPGRGSTFSLYLPRVEEPLTRPELPPRAPPSEVIQPRETVLLVEDEGAVRALARRILVVNGYTVLEAPNGAEALELWSQHQGSIHLVLTDVVMPLMDGRTLVKRLREQQPALPVLFMSGYSDDTRPVVELLSGRSGFLEKPFTLQSLTTQVRAVLDGRKA